MKGDFSRLTFDKDKHYSGVLMQQGRVQVDADWNEQQAIHRHRVETETQDVLGPSGAPIAEGGFEIGVTPDGGDLTLSPGRIYVDGILCELEATSLDVVEISASEGKVRVPTTFVDGRPFKEGQWVEFSARDGENYRARLRITNVAGDPEGATLTCEDPHGTLAALHGGGVTPKLRRATTYTTQPDYLVDPPSVPGFGNGGSCASLVYLDVWEQHVTALDDAHIREVALGGPDTTTRSRTVWQARVLPPVDASDSASALEPLLQTHVDTVSRLDDISSSPGHEREVDKLRAALAHTDSQILKLLRMDCASSLERIKGCNPQSTGRLFARTLQPEGVESSCDVPPHAGYDRLENQLYRVEIHKKGDRDKATFKWSRDNGSVATAVLKITGTTTDGTPTSGEIKVRDLGRDDALGFANDQLVELVDGTTELPVKAGPLLRIVDVDTASLTMRVEVVGGTLPNVSNEEARDLHYKLRRWDSSGDLKMPARDGEFAELEGGIQVRFSEGRYNTGDYWLIPARAATEEIEWPNNQPQLPAGVHHHYAGLALIVAATVHGKRQLLVLSDCRRLFPPLTHESPTPEGIQITQVRLVDPPDGPDLRIDSEVNATDLAQGIEIVCDEGSIDDQPIHGKETASGVATSPTCFVTLEMPYLRSTAQLYEREPNALSVIRSRLVALPTVAKVLAVAALVVLGLAVLLRLLSVDRSPWIVLAFFVLIAAIIVMAILLLWCESLRREGTVVGFRPLILASDVRIANQQKNIIRWRPATETGTWLRDRLFWELGRLSVDRLLVRLTLKGNFIWRGAEQRPLAYLDGDIFGVPGEHTPIELQFPSGDGRQGGDFEMWFWLSQDNHH